MAEEGEVTTPEWVGSIEDAGLKETLSKFESQDKFFESIGYKPPEPEAKDWREQITEADLRKIAEESPDINHLTRRVVEMRQKLSNAVIKPGKDADEKAITSYRKAMGIPEKPDGYEFPDLPEDQLTDEVKESRKYWAETYHRLGIPKEAAESLIAAKEAEEIKRAEDLIKADQAHVKAAEDVLRARYGNDYEKNKTLANRAFKQYAEAAGVNPGDLAKLETKDGRFMMDHPLLMQLFATIGREMAEGTLGPTLTESEKDTLDDEIRGLREKQEEAKSKGDSKLANRLYQQEQALIAKRHGNKPVVGVQGRAA